MQCPALVLTFTVTSLLSSVESLSVYRSERGPLTSLLFFNSEKLIVGGRNSIYSFPLGNLTRNNLEFELDTRCMNPTCDVANSTGNDVSILSEFTNAGTNYILFCGTENGQRCYAIKYNDKIQCFEITYQTLGSRTSAIAVRTESYGEHFFISAINEGTPTISEKAIHVQNDEFMLIPPISSVPIQAAEGEVLDFVYGFEGQDISLDGKYIYLLRNNQTGDFTKAFISQTCSEGSYFKSYVEARITCGDYSILEAAYYRNTTKGAFMITAFKSKMYQGTALCVSAVGELDAWFKKAKRKCFIEASGSWPFWIKPADAETEGFACTTQLPDTRVSDIYCDRRNYTRILAKDDMHETPILVDVLVDVTSVLMTSQDDIFVIYTGDAKGFITKILFDGDFNRSMVLYSVNTNSSLPIGRDMQLDEARNHLYFTYGDKVAMLRTDDCSLHSTCVTCLSGRASCQWVMDDDGGPRGTCAHGDTHDQGSGSGNGSVFTDHCLPEIETVRPLTSPTQGGTPLVIHGKFDGLAGDQSRLRVSVGEGIPCLVTNVSNERISCTTGPVTMETLEAKVTVTVLGNMPGIPEGQLSVPVSGKFTYKGTFLYKTPAANLSEPEVFIRQSGGVRIHINGTDLDIGATRAVTIGNRRCVMTSHDIASTETVTCRAPAMAETGSYASQLVIDGATVQGPNFTYIDDPVIHSVRPNKAIVSGGVKLTFNGTNFLGLGFSVMYIRFLDSDNSVMTTSPGRCYVVNDQLECISGAVKVSDVMPVECSVLIDNLYNDTVLFRTNQTVLVVQDPELSPLQQLVYVTSDRGELTLKGRDLLNIEKYEIIIHVDSEKCSVEMVGDDWLNCSFGVTEAMMTGKALQVKAAIGYRKYQLGHVTYQQISTQQPGNTTTYQIQGRIAPVAPIAEANSGLLSFVVGVAAFVALMILLIVSLALYRKRKRRRLNLSEPYSATYRNGEFITLDGLSGSHLAENEQNQQNVYQEQTFAKSANDDPAAQDTEPLLLDDNLRLFLERQNLLIDRNCLVMAEVIGQGHFGCVYKCFYTVPGEKEEKIVAAKTLHRVDPKDIDVQMFMKEALLMKDFHHRHVMELVGICMGPDRLPLVILPYMRAGDLLTYLRDAKNMPTVSDLVVFGIDIANGMHYLSELKFVHRDLAARNCMLTDDLTVKIADFGLSRDVYEKEYYSSHDKNAKLPIKWMSPESLEFRTFTSKSDVWSYGVVLWELLTRGMTPYPTVDNWEILRYLKEGRRMVKPDHCPGKVYKIMQRCWAWEPDDRPSFGDLTIEMPEIVKPPKQASFN